MCEIGEVFNPVSGQCAPRTVTDRDSGTPNNNLSANNTTANNTAANNSTSPDMGTVEPDMSTTCTGNERRCNGSTVERCVNGEFVLSQTCEAGFVCNLGNCIPEDLNSCSPGETRCNGITGVQTCSAEGEWGEITACAADEECSAGICTKGCAGFIDKKSNVGCDYISMRHDQLSGLRVLPHTVVVSNPNADPVTIDVTSPSAVNPGIAQQVIQPNDSAVLDFPTSPMVSSPGITDTIYQIRSSLPVIATQFAPLNNPGLGSETSDASLLLPTNAVGLEYIVLGWRGLQPGGSYIDIVALEPNTSVTVESPTPLTGGAAGTVPENGSGTFSIPANRVLHLEESRSFFDSGDRDVSGAIVTANKPVLVFTGATLVNIPDSPLISGAVGCNMTGQSCTANADCCSGICGYDTQNGTVVCMDSLAAGDHIEQQLFPVESWGTSYVGVPFPSRGVNDFTIYRIVGAVDGTSVTVDPPLNGTSSFTVNRGQVKEFYGTEAFELTATQKVMVAQFMIGGATSSGDDGDPAFLGPPAVEQYRDSYVFLVPGNYRKNRVTLVKKAGTQITLDGTPVPQSEFAPVGGSSVWEHATINSLAEGVHNATSTQPFGVVVHGVDEYISYAFAGGITLPN